MLAAPDLSAWVARFAASPLAGWDLREPWSLTTAAAQVVESLLAGLDGGYAVADTVAVHRSGVVEPGATVKGPAIIGPGCFVAAGAYLRGGTWLDADVIVGPGAELKSSFVFRGSKLAHLNFVGDSVLGEGVNLEAGSIVANYRNERADKRIRVALDGATVDTGVDKFGAFLGDGCRVGANAVIAPGALLAPGTQVPRLGLVDMAPVGLR